MLSPFSWPSERESQAVPNAQWGRGGGASMISRAATGQSLPRQRYSNEECGKLTRLVDHWVQYNANQVNVVPLHVILPPLSGISCHFCIRSSPVCHSMTLVRCTECASLLLKALDVRLAGRGSFYGVLRHSCGLKARILDAPQIKTAYLVASLWLLFWSKLRRSDGLTLPGSPKREVAGGSLVSVPSVRLGGYLLLTKSLHSTDTIVCTMILNIRGSLDVLTRRQSTMSSAERLSIRHLR
jgi:hypothetical protein